MGWIIAETYLTAGPFYLVASICSLLGIDWAFEGFLTIGCIITAFATMLLLIAALAWIAKPVAGGLRWLVAEW